MSVLSSFAIKQFYAHDYEIYSPSPAMALIPKHQHNHSSAVGRLRESYRLSFICNDPFGYFNLGHQFHYPITALAAHFFFTGPPHEYQLTPMTKNKNNGHIISVPIKVFLLAVTCYTNIGGEAKHIKSISEKAGMTYKQP